MLQWGKIHQVFEWRLRIKFRDRFQLCKIVSRVTTIKKKSNRTENVSRRNDIS